MKIKQKLTSTLKLIMKIKKVFFPTSQNIASSYLITRVMGNSFLLPGLFPTWKFLEERWLGICTAGDRTLAAPEARTDHSLESELAFAPLPPFITLLDFSYCLFPFPFSSQYSLLLQVWQCLSALLYLKLV